MTFLTVPSTPSIEPFPWLFSLKSQLSLTPSKEFSVKRRKTKLDRSSEQPSLRTMIWDFPTLILSASPITFCKHINAAILLCSLLSLTTLESFFTPYIIYRLTTCCENTEGTASKASTLSLILLYILHNSAQSTCTRIFHGLSVFQSDCMFGFGPVWRICAFSER